MENGQHDCQKLALKIVDYIGGGMTPDDERALIAEVNRCPQCLETLDLEQGFTDFLSSKVSRKSLSPEALNIIKNQVRSHAAG
jgi:hypothetical protein